MHHMIRYNIMIPHINFILNCVKVQKWTLHMSMSKLQFEVTPPKCKPKYHKTQVLGGKRPNQRIVIREHSTAHKTICISKSFVIYIPQAKPPSGKLPYQHLAEAALHSHFLYHTSIIST